VDKTLWYAFADEKLFGVDQESSNKFYEREKSPSKGKSPFPEGKSPTPIPDTIPDTKTEEEEREGAAPPPSAPPPPPSKKIPPRKKAPEVKNEVAPRVFLTPSQVESLKTRLEPLRIDLHAVLDRLSVWKIGNEVEGGRNDYGAIIKWVIDAVVKDKSSTPSSHATHKNSPGSHNSTSEGDNRAMAHSLRKEYLRLFQENLIDDYNSNYLAFPKVNSIPVKIYYNDPKFVELVRHEIRKILDKGE
jgi:hypothetical protein